MSKLSEIEASLSGLTVGDLIEIKKCDGMKLKEALPVLREFRDKHGLNDKQTLAASALARRLLE